MTVTSGISPKLRSSGDVSSVSVSAPVSGGGGWVRSSPAAGAAGWRLGAGSGCSPGGGGRRLGLGLLARFLALRQLGLVLAWGLTQRRSSGQEPGQQHETSETKHRHPLGDANLMKYKQLRKGVLHENLKLWQQNNTFRYYNTT